MKLINKIKSIIHPSRKEYYRWMEDSGYETHYMNWDLDENSLIFEVGGFKGDSVQRFWDKFHCHIWVFEPVKEYYLILKKRFEGKEKIKIFNFALGIQDGLRFIKKQGNETSILESGSELITVAEFPPILKVDLVNINIEGYEYNLLEHLLAKDLIRNIKYLQIEFHKNVKDYSNRRKCIRLGLSETHKQVYNYPYIFEGWSSK